MAFQIKDFASVTASAINWMRSVTTKVTDFNIGSVVRTMLEAVAAEIEEAYIRFFVGVKEAIPVAVYNSFDFVRLGEQTASGQVRVTIGISATDTIIVAGTRFSTPGKALVYVATQDVTITAGDTVGDVSVAASVVGVIGNLEADAAFTMQPSPSGFVSASNAVAFVNGADEETDDQRKLRFNQYIASLARGTVGALEYGLSTVALYDASGNETERVAMSVVEEPYLADPLQPIAWVRCHIHNGTGDTSPDLVARALVVLHGYTDDEGEKVPGWKAAGVKVDVLAAEEVDLNVVCERLEVLGGFEEHVVRAEVTAAVLSYLLTLPIGETAIRSEMIAIGMNVTGVYNFRIKTPTGDTATALNEKIMPGEITFDGVITPSTGTLALTGKLATRTP
jgi:uncharacterized phage protein gp47/JayE